jgi:hypothetical protein
MRLNAALTILFTWCVLSAASAQPGGNTDTIFRAFANASAGNAKSNPFINYTGKTIRNIYIRNVGFEGDVRDTTKVNGGFGVQLGNKLHKNTRNRVILNNLLFREGEKLNPFLLSDNERHLRDLEFIQDAMILVKKIPGSAGAVDLVIVVKDGFSLLPGMGVGGTRKYRLELKEENLAGTGSKLAVSTLYDHARQPRFGVGAEFLQRNIAGTFINWGLGFKNYNNAFNSNRNEEQTYYLRFEKPLASQYLRWFGALDLSYNQTSNAYISDSAYRLNDRYGFYNIDGWIAWNIGAGRMRYKPNRSSIRQLLSVRSFFRNFSTIPDKNQQVFDGLYANSTGVLGSFSIFKQNFYRTSYIYGFGRNEDVPQGFNLSLVGGYVQRDSLNSRSRTSPYYGMEFSGGRYSKRGFYSFYQMRLGGYRFRGRWEDVTLLVNADHFTRLRMVGMRWYRRYFFSGSFAKQYSPSLEQSLQLRSPGGLPYFGFGYDDLFGRADLRTTLKSEMVFYHTRKYMGFGLAPFAFADLTLLKPVNSGFSGSNLFSGIGGGIRLRNENLLFGTIEARAAWFPRILPGMNHVWIKFNTNLRYKYNSSFVRRPDFVSPNL